MKLVALKNYLTLNLLSILGHISLLVLFFVLFWLIPVVRIKANQNVGIDSEFYYIGTVLGIIGYFLLQYSLVILLVILAILEAIFKHLGLFKIEINFALVPKLIGKVYSFLFWFGLLNHFIIVWFFLIVPFLFLLSR